MNHMGERQWSWSYEEGHEQQHVNQRLRAECSRESNASPLFWGLWLMGGALGRSLQRPWEHLQEKVGSNHLPIPERMKSPHQGRTLISPHYYTCILLLTQLSKRIADGGSQVSHCWSGSLQRKGYTQGEANDPSGNGLKLEISVWTHVYLNTGIDSYIYKYL